MRWSIRIAVILAVLCAVAALILPELGTIAAITIIGLPLAAMYWAMPAIMLVIGMAWLIHRFLPHFLPARPVIAIAVSLALLAVPPFVVNPRIERDARALTAGDHDDIRLPLDAGSIALRPSNWRNLRRDFDDGYTVCNQLCLHALLNGSADRFLISTQADPHTAISAAKPAIEYRLQKSTSCEPAKFRQTPSDLHFPRSNDSQNGDAVEALRLREVAGTCLVGREAMLADARIVITEGPAKKRARTRLDTGFDLGADTINANRISVHRIETATREPVEIFRKTSVSYRPLAPLLLPVPEFGAEFRTSMVWWRLSRSINPGSKYAEKRDWTDFLTEKLGMELMLKPNGEKGDPTIAATRAIIAANRAPTAAEWQLIATHFEKTGLGTRNGPKKEDFDLASAIVRDIRFPVPPRLHAIVSSSTVNAAPDDLDSLTSSLLHRLQSKPAYGQELGADWESQIREISIALWNMPDEIVAAHAEGMLAAAKDAQVRENGRMLLKKLHVLGAVAVLLQVELIDAGLAGGKNFFRENRYQHPYIGGLEGMCLAGQSASSALPQLRERIGAGSMPLHASYGKLLTVTLIRLGADEEMAFRVYSAGKRGSEPENIRRLFAALVKRSKSDRPDCWF